jgi:hypothetical protein
MNVDKCSQEQAPLINFQTFDHGCGGMKRIRHPEIQSDSCSLALGLIEIVNEILKNVDHFNQLAKFREISTSWQLIVD